jgi:hypothetical protein
MISPGVVSTGPHYFESGADGAITNRESQDTNRSRHPLEYGQHVGGCRSNPRDAAVEAANAARRTFLSILPHPADNSVALRTGEAAPRGGGTAIDCVSPRSRVGGAPLRLIRKKG